MFCQLLSTSGREVLEPVVGHGLAEVEGCAWTLVDAVGAHRVGDL